MSSSPRRASPSLAAFLSFLWPGLGQLYQQRRRTALFFAVPALLVLVWAILQLVHGPLWFAAAMLGSDYALTIVLLAVVVGLWRAISVFHAFLISAPGRRPSRVEQCVLALLLVAVLAVHGAVAINAVAVFNFDRQIASNDFAETSPDPQADSSGFPTSMPGLTPLPYQVEPGSTPSSHRVTVLLTGVDFQTGRSHALNDTLLVVSMDTNTGQAAMISVPRDTSSYPLYWGGVGQVKINALQTYVRNHWLLPPDPPLTALVKEIGFLIGVPVNYYAQIDMDGFKQLIDLVGGVDVINPKPLADPYYGTWHEPAGPIHLNGKNALIYVRSRHSAGDNDYGRSSRQQDVLIALAKKLANPSMALKFQQVLGLAGGAVQTNFPLNTVKDYVSFLDNFTAGQVSKCVLGPPYSWHPDSSTTGGAWTSRLNLDKVADLSVQLFGADSAYYGKKGVSPAPCAS
jgi:polyisoprenyl-teichoic acid--peptidoglycan teichoic acid transferase